MERKTQLSKLIFEIVFSANFLVLAAGYLDLEELRNINYGIDIVDVPVSLNPENSFPENSVQVTSKYGQLYQCSFPNQVEADKKKDEEEKVAMETGITELLKPMESGSCLFKTRDWWSYEFCYGKHIRQFHLEDGKVMGSVIMLGYYESDFDWDKDTEESKTKQRNRLNRYHSQQYVNGSKCDLTGKARRTEVRFVCEEGSGDYIARLDEPETCSYIMTIHTTKICHHPYLKPPEQNKPVPITCHPIISQEEYKEYLKEEEEKKILQEKLEEEERLAKEAEESASLMEGEEPVSMAAKGTTPDSPILPHSMKKTDKGRNFEFRDVSDVKAGEMSKIEKLLQNSLKEDFDKLTDQFGGQPLDVKMDIKVVKNMDDLQKVIEEAQKDAKKLVNSRLKKEERKKDGEKDAEEEEEEDGKSESERNEGEEELDEEEGTDQSEDRKLKFEKKSFKRKFFEEAQDLDDELSSVDSNLKEDFEQGEGRDKIQHMIQEFRRNQKNLASIKNSLKETMKEEFDNIIEEGEGETGIKMTDKKEGYKELADTLNKLIDKLDKTEKDITDVDKELEELAIKKSKNKKSQVDIQREDEMEDESIDDKENSETSQKAAASSSSKSSLKSSSLSSKSKSLDDRVKVRVTKLKQGTLKGSSPLASNAETEKLEQEVKDGLEKAGLDLGEGKIQVKIITAGYYDDKDDSIHVLSDEDTSAFKNMIVSILGGDHEASKEQQRYDKLEGNYNTVWSSKNRKKSQTTTP